MYRKSEIVMCAVVYTMSNIDANSGSDNKSKLSSQLSYYL